MQEKYYTPEIEDIRLGYECLWFGAEENGQKIVVKDVQDLQFVISEIASKTIETLYLTKEQIEAEGWDYLETIDCLHFQNKSIKNILLDYFYKTKFCRIYLSDGSCNFFFGKCKSINEFRTLLKWLEI